MSLARISSSQPTAPAVGSWNISARLVRGLQSVSASVASTPFASCVFSAAIHALVFLILALWLVPIRESTLISLTAQTNDGLAPQFADIHIDARPPAALAEHEDAAAITELKMLSGDAVSFSPAERLVPAIAARRKLPWGQLLSELAARRSGQVSTDFRTALNFLAQDIAQALRDDNLLLVWCFDESTSMQDDQAEIRNQIDHLYATVAALSNNSNNTLLSTVSSYGAGFNRLLRKPTADLREVKRAIAAVPIDPSGIERMCSALQQAMLSNQQHANELQRRMMIILVTDETGDREENEYLLEETINTARQHRCRIFVLGREACFGSLHAYMNDHAAIDRGPESAFLEQLQLGGIRAPTINSGFGTFEQARLARESGGGLYLLAGLDPTTLYGRPVSYRPEDLAPYQPDLQPRAAQLILREQRPLRMALKEVNESLAGIDTATHLPYAFQANAERFARDARSGIRQAEKLAELFLALQSRLDEVAEFRANETPRWRANYDLTYAQLVGLQALSHEYRANLEQTLKLERRDLTAALVRAPLWTLQRTSDVVNPASKPIVDEAEWRFREILQEHAGTPWAARAEFELEEGFSLRLIPR